MKSSVPKDDLKASLARMVLSRVLEPIDDGDSALEKWLDTLAHYGSVPKKGKGELGVPPSARVSAAKAGVDFVTKFLGDAGATAAGTDLLARLGRVGRAAEEAESGDPDRAESRAEPQDPDEGS